MAQVPVTYRGETHKGFFSDVISEEIPQFGLKGTETE